MVRVTLAGARALTGTVPGVSGDVLRAASYSRVGPRHRLAAWVRLRPGADELTAEALREFCTGKLAHYKIPRYVRVVDEFPMTVTGKVRKVEMRERAIELLSAANVPPNGPARQWPA